MERGSLIVVSVSGDHGKPRPAVVIQNEKLRATGSLLVCLLSSEIGSTGPHRLFVRAEEATGLLQDSIVMTEKIYPVARQKCGAPFGRLSVSTMTQLDMRLAFVIGLAE